MDFLNDWSNHLFLKTVSTILFRSTSFIPFFLLGTYYIANFFNVVPHRVYDQPTVHICDVPRELIIRDKVTQRAVSEWLKNIYWKFIRYELQSKNNHCLPSGHRCLDPGTAGQTTVDSRWLSPVAQRTSGQHDTKINLIFIKREQLNFYILTSSSDSIG